MIDRSNLPPCPVETTLMLIGDKWKVLILRDLMGGDKTLRRAEKIGLRHIPEGSDGKSS